MELFDSSLRPDPSAVVHSPRNYFIVAGALFILLLVAGVFGHIRSAPTVLKADWDTEYAGSNDGPTMSAQQQPQQAPAAQWIPYSQLLIPDGMQVYSDCGGPKCGETVAVAYDGSAPPDQVFTLPQDDLTWPDLKVTAFSHSAKIVYLQPDVDKATLEITPSGSYMRDKNHVYYFRCLAYACAYDRLTGLDPASFDPANYAPIRH